MMFLLTKLFNSCFSNGCVPDCLLTSIITPIPKGKDKDPNVPLSYHGLSFVSCVAKLFTGVLNRRIVGYLDNHNIIAEEQNVFHKNRKNLLAEEHVSSIDMCKEFDWVDRNLLFNKLLKYNIYNW